jgi:PKD repeat protein
MLAVVTGTLVLASACSDGAGTPPSDNTAPEANFAVPPCTIDVPCDFASTSTDDEGVTRWSWDFDGDDAADANTANASFRYSTAAAFDVSLTVWDAQGLSHTKTSTITIAAGNTPPTAGFTYACTAADCTFTSTSADAAPGTIAIYAWTFGDGAEADVSTPSHSYTVTAPTDFTVTLTVTDNDGATDVETQTVTVSPPPNTPPTAGFTYSCPGAVCTFTSTSTDVVPGSIVTYAWTFGDDGTADVMNPKYSYAITVPHDFTVTLTVTDDQGLTDVETKTIPVSPPPHVPEGCATTGNRIDCAFDITVRSHVRLTLLGVSCDLDGQRVVIPPPIGDQSFLGVCKRTAGEFYKIYGGPHDSAIVFEVGSQARIRFVQGTPDGGQPAVAPPAAQVTGTFPLWTINFEDGANPGGAGEPDFTDVVLKVEAVPPVPGM